MRGSGKYRSLGFVVATVVVVAALLVSTTAFVLRMSSAEAAVPRKCTVLNDLTEQTMKHHFTGQDTRIPVQNVGEGLIYYDNLYDRQNRVVGNAVGFVSGIYKRPSDGHLMAQYYETVQLPGGAFSTSGINDRTAIFSGAPARFTAVGMTGEYAGLRGDREWQLPTRNSKQLSNDTRTTVRIKLCG